MSAPEIGLPDRNAWRLTGPEMSKLLLRPMIKKKDSSKEALNVLEKTILRQISWTDAT